MTNQTLLKQISSLPETPSSLLLLDTLFTLTSPCVQLEGRARETVQRIDYSNTNNVKNCYSLLQNNRSIPQSLNITFTHTCNSNMKVVQLNNYLLDKQQKHLVDRCMSISQSHCEDTPTHFPHYQYSSDH